MNFLSSFTPPLNRPSGVDWRGGKKRVQECREKKVRGNPNRFFKTTFLNGVLGVLNANQKNDFYTYCCIICVRTGNIALPRKAPIQSTSAEVRLLPARTKYDVRNDAHMNNENNHGISSCITAAAAATNLAALQTEKTRRSLWQGARALVC